MAYSETFSRYCTTSGPSYSFTQNYCPHTAHTDYSRNVCSNYYSDGYSYCSEGYSRSHYSKSYDTYWDEYYGDDGQDPGYLNTPSSGSYCNDYTDCSDYSHYDNVCDHDYSNYSRASYSKQACTNYTNQCTVTWSYTNYANVAPKYNTGQAKTLTWDQPALQVSSDVASISDPKEYLAVMTELKTKINTLCSSKGRNKVTANSTSIASGNSLASQYNGLRATLNSLYTDLKQTSTTAPTATVYKRTLGTDISGLRNQIDDLAKAVITYANYVNHSNAFETAATASGSDSCNNRVTNTSYIDSISYTNSSSNQCSHNSTTTAYARYLDYSRYQDNPKTS